MQDFSAPVRKPNTFFERFGISQDSAKAVETAYLTAEILVTPRPGVLAADLLAAIDEQVTAEDLSALWGRSLPRTRPYCLLKLYEIRQVLEANEPLLAEIFNLGYDALPTIDPFIVGFLPVQSLGQIRRLPQRILEDAFDGRFPQAVERAAAFYQIIASGAVCLARYLDHPQSVVLTRQAAEWLDAALHLAAAARRERRSFGGRIYLPGRRTPGSK